MRIYRGLSVFLLLMFACGAHAQLDEASKKRLKKAERKYKRERYYDAAEFAKSVIEKYPVNENLWKFYLECTFQHYKNNRMEGFDLTIKTDDKSVADSTLQKVQEELIYHFNKPKYDYYNALYYSTMALPYSGRNSLMLRKIYVDDKYFSLEEVNSKSRAFLAQGEGEFRAKNYSKAIDYYQQAYNSDSTNYQAIVYIGDAYFAMEYYGDAAAYFRQAIANQPYLSEPRKYLAEVLEKKREYVLAVETLKECLYVYPEEAVYAHLSGLLKHSTTKALDRNWILRLASINSVTDKLRRGQFYDDKLHFQYYVDALEKAKLWYNENGIRKGTADSTLPKYLEVYSFEAMLKATEGLDVPALQYARKMKEQGLLAPYVLIGLFSVDLYPQYRDLVDFYKPQVDRYINEYLIVYQ